MRIQPTLRGAVRSLAVLTFLTFGAATAQDDVDPDLVAQGETIYRTAGNVGCGACHGAYALGDLQLGPEIRGVDAVRIQGSLEAAEEMAFLLPILSQEDIEALEAYLAYLDTLEPASAVVRRGVFEPAEVTLPPESDVQLIVQNGNRSTCTLTVDGVDDTAEIDGRAYGAVTWTTGAAGDATEAYCAEEPEARLTVTIAQASP